MKSIVAILLIGRSVVSANANISVYRISAGGSFSIPHWSGKGGTAYSVSANAGGLSSTRAGGAIY